MKETGDPREYEAFIREIDDSRYAIDKDMVPRGVIPKRRGMSLSRSLAMEGVFPFTNFAPRLLASLVANSTAACTSGVVTVTATSHGIPATVFDEMQFYYPGSPSLAAGWYSGFARTSADALIFSAPDAADFASESVNAGAALVNEITVASMVIKANELTAGDIVRVDYASHGDAVTSAKTYKVKLNTTVLGVSSTSTATSSFLGALTFCIVSAQKQFGVGAREGTASTTEYSGSENVSGELTLSLTAQLAGAGMYVATPVAKARIN